MKDLRLIVRVKNNRLIRERERRGLSQEKMAELCEMSYGRYNVLENLREFPVTKSGDWTVAAKRISLVVDIPEYELFPEAFKLIKANKLEREVGLEELPQYQSFLQINGPEEELEEHDRGRAVEEVLSQLTARQRFAVEQYFGFEGEEYTLEDIGNELFVSRTRAQLILFHALRKLREPVRARKIKQFID